MKNLLFKKHVRDDERESVEYSKTASGLISLSNMKPTFRRYGQMQFIHTSSLIVMVNTCSIIVIMVNITIPALLLPLLLFSKY